MAFPAIGDDRVDADFRSQDARFGHKGLSPLIRLVNFDMVHDCSVEPMHLVTNVVRRLIGKFFHQKYLQEGVTLDELDNAVVDASAWLLNSCFRRKIRSLRGYEQWRATKCRQSILYISLAVLMGRLTDSCYRLTKPLSVALIIQSTYGICQSTSYNERAHRLLKRVFVLWTSNFSAKMTLCIASTLLCI